jgi:hypothetical protein
MTMEDRQRDREPEQARRRQVLERREQTSGEGRQPRGDREHAELEPEDVLAERLHGLAVLADPAQHAAVR